MRAVDVLIRAKELISNPNAWIKGAYCNNEQTQFCAHGAIRAASNEAPQVVSYPIPKDTPSSRAAAYFTAAAGEYLERFNDYEKMSWKSSARKTTTHADVMAVFDMAIADAKRRHKRPYSRSFLSKNSMRPSTEWPCLWPQA